MTCFEMASSIPV